MIPPVPPLNSSELSLTLCPKSQKSPTAKIAVRLSNQ
jgi:hypothetical protein